MDELKKCVEVLAKKSTETKDPLSALQFSQAACNAANALAQLQNIENQRKETPNWYDEHMK